MWLDAFCPKSETWRDNQRSKIPASDERRCRGESGGWQGVSRYASSHGIEEVASAISQLKTHPSGLHFDPERDTKKSLELSPVGAPSGLLESISRLSGARELTQRQGGAWVVVRG